MNQSLREVRIDLACALTGLLIGVIQSQQHFFVGVVAMIDMRRAPPFIFMRIDVPLNAFGRPAVLVQLVLLNQPLDQAKLVLTINNLEVLRQIGLLPVRF